MERPHFPFGEYGLFFYYSQLLGHGGGPRVINEVGFERLVDGQEAYLAADSTGERGLQAIRNQPLRGK
jgi:hypothetical protein